MSPSSCTSCGRSTLDVDLLAGVPVDERVSAALAGDDVPGDGGPADDTAGGEDDGVEHPVVEPRAGHEDQPAEEPAAVAHDHGPGPSRELALAVDLHPHPELWTEEVLEPRHDVGGRTHAGLEPLLRAGHDRRVQADAGHDEEEVLVRDGVLSRRVHRQTTDVDADVLARQRHDQGLLDGVERQVEVAGEQVPRAARQRAERGLGPHERRGDGPHRPVPAERADDRGALLDGPSRLAGTRVGDGRLEPDRLAPTLRQTGRGDPRPDGVEVGELRRVDDDPGPLQRGRILVETLGAEVVAVRAAATSGDPRGLQNVSRRATTTATTIARTTTTTTIQNAGLSNTGRR